MNFKTQYDARERVETCPGSPVKQLYSGRYNERGQVELTPDGTDNIYEFIQSFAESTDIHTILRRYQNGEADVLSKVQGVYADITEMPASLYPPGRISYTAPLYLSYGAVFLQLLRSYPLPQ